jgi:hypothetical protein
VRTIAYIDGFNLYYSMLRGTGARWLDLPRLVSRSFPSDAVEAVWYFTAVVHKSEDDPKRPKRQIEYIRLLEATGVRVQLGSFTRHKVWTKTVEGSPVRVVRVQEKGSDVNLATRLLIDAASGAFEQAVIVSNDSDLQGPILHVSQNLNLRVTVLQPVLRRAAASVSLARAATASKLLDARLLSQCLFPDTLAIAGTSYRKPETW